MAFDYAAKIGKLIAMAEDETLPDVARASYRQMAEDLMRKYRIAEEEAIATESSAAVPVSDSITIMESRAYYNPLRDYYWDMWSRIAQHCGIRTAGGYGEDELVATAIGYEGDIRYAELLFTASRLVFMTRIDARVNPQLSDQVNCYYMRASGMSRRDIATKLWQSEATDGAAHSKVQKLYAAECILRGETPKVSGRGIQADVYRDAYARGFVNELSWRLRIASSAVDKVSGGLVLHGRKERVDEAFYAEFPKHRPMSDEEYAQQVKEREEAEANCSSCKSTKHESGKCKTHRPYEVSAAMARRYDRRYHSSEARAGERAGELSARDVHIGRVGEKAPRPTEAAAEQTALGV
jgi:hypothetical protein